MSILDKVKQRREQYKVNQAGRAKVYKFKEGKTIISFLPLHEDLTKNPVEQDFVREYGMHYLKDAKGKLIVSVGDASLTYGRDCPVREGLVDMIGYAKEIGDDDLAKQAKDSLARKNILMGVYVHKTPNGEYENTAQIISVSENFFDQLSAILEEHIEEDPSRLLRFDNRIAFIVERTGTTSTDTRYTIIPAGKGQTIPADTMDKAVNLDEYIKGQFDDSIQKALNFIGTVTGKSVAGSAAEAALTGGTTAPKLEGPKTTAKVVEDEEDDFAPAPSKRTAPPSALDKAVVEDAEFTDAPWEGDAATSEEDEDLLAQIAELAA